MQQTQWKGSNGPLQWSYKGTHRPNPLQCALYAAALSVIHHNHSVPIHLKGKHIKSLWGQDRQIIRTWTTRWQVCILPSESSFASRKTVPPLFDWDTKIASQDILASVIPQAVFLPLEDRNEYELLSCPPSRYIALQEWKILTLPWDLHAIYMMITANWTHRKPWLVSREYLSLLHVRDNRPPLCRPMPSYRGRRQDPWQ